MQLKKEFERTYLKFSDKIYKYVYLNTRDPNLAEDITSEVFLKVWKNWEKINTDFIQAYLYKVAKSVMIDHFRKDSRTKKTSLEDMTELGIEPHYDENLIEKLEKDENIGKVTRALQYLSKNLKEVVILRFVNELSARETGQILGISEVNVRVLQFRALKKLKEIISNE